MHIIQAEIEKRGFIGAESRRLFHGRGQCFRDYEDIVIDWFKPVVLITLYRCRTEAWIAQLVSLLHTQHDGIEAIILQERYLCDSPSCVLSGELPATVNAVEAGLKYRLRLLGAQNIGFFPDMAVGRALVREIAVNKKVLNLFAYTCSFSVAAISAGAAQVVNVDMNSSALNLGRLNHQINHLDLRNASFLALEIFRSFSRLRKLAPFDLIICDPPLEQGMNFRPSRDWSRLVRKLPALLCPGGDLLVCLSSPHLHTETIQQLFVQLCPQAQLQQVLHAGDGFPEINQAKSLNILHYQISLMS